MNLFLGIDIGTTKVAALMVDDGGTIHAVSAFESGAALKTPSGRAEQDPRRILQTVDACIEAIPSAVKMQIGAVGVTGQMHGMLLWNAGDSATSPLVTWQDQRVLEDGFLDSLRAKTGDTQIAAGYGCATLAWLAAHAPAMLAQYRHATTIHDFLVAMLCGLEQPVTDATDAASFGFYDLLRGAWNEEKLSAAGIDSARLPAVCAPGSRAGALGAQFASQWGLPEGIPVAAAIGDNQASLRATLDNPEAQVALTLGTGGQVSCIVPHVSARDLDEARTFEYRPYLKGAYAAVAASLCGGSAFAWLAGVAEEWCRVLGCSAPPREAIYAALVREGLRRGESSLVVKPHFLGERYDATLRGSVCGIDSANLVPGTLARALCLGVAQNLKDMLPVEHLDGKTEIVASGNAIRRSPLMQACIEEVFERPVRLRDGQEEAALGAALIAAGLAQ